jgi:hypothetical protein
MSKVIGIISIMIWDKNRVYWIERNAVPSLLVPSLPYMVVHMIAEGAIVSCGPVPMHPKFIWWCWGMSGVGVRKLMTIGELTSGKSLDCWAWKSFALGVVLGTGTEVGRGNTYEQGKSGRGERR